MYTMYNGLFVTHVQWMYVYCFIKRDFNHDLLSTSGYYVTNFSHTQYNLFLVMSKK